MNYGYFDDKNREYVITRPDTPKPWSNYIGNSEFGGVITNNAAGYTFYKSAAQGRLTRFYFNGKPSNFPGRFIYLKDVKSGKIWSNSWMPTAVQLEDFKYECRHGSGYTKLKSEFNKIQSEATYFVPNNSLFEVWKITVKNNDEKKRTITVVPFVEPQCNWNAEDDGTNLQYTQYISKTTFKDGLIDIGSNVNMPEDPEHFENKDQKRHTFFALSGADVVAFEADLEKFFGTYGDYKSPKGLQNERLSNSTATGDMPCAALQTELELMPGESKSFAVVFGVGEAATIGKAAIESVNSKEKIDEAIEEVKNHWHSKLNRLYAETPDENFNFMVNMWAPFNNLMTFYWSRTASLVYAGERDGLGFRDTVQDIVGSTALITEESKKILELITDLHSRFNGHELRCPLYPHWFII